MDWVFKPFGAIWYESELVVLFTFPGTSTIALNFGCLIKAIPSSESKL